MFAARDYSRDDSRTRSSGVLLHPGDPDLRRPLMRSGFAVSEARDKSTLLGKAAHATDVMIVGSSRSDPGGTIETAGEVRQRNHVVPIIVVTAGGSEERAIAALRAGVDDYLRLPVAPDTLIASVRRCLSGLPRQSATHRDAAHGSPPLAEPTMIGDSHPMRCLRTQLTRLAASDSNVLIVGETGTGKELAAEFIHANSTRRGRPFARINCAAIPDTLIESELFGYERGAFTGAHTRADGRLTAANGGTVLFDEIGDMSPYAQAKLLRVIEYKELQRLGSTRTIPVDIRVLAATNQNLEALVADNRFRRDLYFRLNVASVALPPLRERREDIPPLLSHYLRHFARTLAKDIERFSDEVIESVLQYGWPGNVRELKHFVEATALDVSASTIGISELPERYQRCFAGPPATSPSERERLLCALTAARWNKSAAAQKLRWSRMTLYRKMARYYISPVPPAVDGASAATLSQPV